MNKAHISISKSEGLQVITEYEVLAVSPAYTLLNVKPITGRSHQIRAHFAAIGHPLAGDKKYGGSSTPYAPAQLLHCRQLTLSQYDWTAELPKGFCQCLKDWFGMDFIK
jgi:23S rRNA-/tRNA-specific pseudouridylate synthase